MSGISDYPFNILLGFSGSIGTSAPRLFMLLIMGFAIVYFRVSLPSQTS